MNASRRYYLTLAGLLAIASVAVGGAPQTSPPAGLRETTSRVHALVGGKVVVSPETTFEKATIVVRDGVIVAVGEHVTRPADAQMWDVTGRTLYAGFIDAYSELSAEASRGGINEKVGAGYWNPNIVPHARAGANYSSDAGLNRKLRSQGIAARLVAPSVGIIKGTSALVSTADGSGQQVILNDPVGLHLKLTVTRGVGGYPNSPMGAYTLVRQAFYDAGWHGQAWDAHERNPELPRPEQSEPLAVLRGYLGRKPLVVIDAQDELYFMRADRIAREFNLNAAVRGSGDEYRRLDAVKATGRAVIVPLAFPKAPNVATPEAAMNVALDRLMHWELAPENAGRLDSAGVKIAFTTQGLKDVDSFLAAIRKAVKRGLKPEAALRALTVTPAELFEASNRLGTLEVGKAANIVVASGAIFEPKTTILETWIDGQRHEVQSEPASDLRGTWNLDIVKPDTAKPDGQAETLSVELTGEPGKLKGKIKRGDKSTPLIAPRLDALQFTAAFKGEPLGLMGVQQVSVTVSLPTGTPSSPPAEPTWLGSIVWPDGVRTAATGKRVAQATDAPGDPAKEKPSTDKPAEKPDATAPADKPAATPTPEPAKPGVEADNKTDPKALPPAKPDAEDKSDAASKSDDKADAESKPEAEAPGKVVSLVNFPLGAFGRKAPPDQPAALLFRNATIWTSGAQGRLDNADLLVEAGTIRAVGQGLAAPAGALVIDATGKHLSAGIIDCHSHAATDGGINEAGQTITAEVRIGDFIDPTDINIYRQLAGGVTTANILHGSANTIGGQNQVVKFRWGAGPEEMKFVAAPPGIKFALGENVKQSNRPTIGSRYPQSRMGVEQLVHDAFQAARQYRRQWDAWNRTKVGLPPRVDLELEALAEVVEGKRLIHCHSYRQDEILALLRTCEAQGVKIATLQHILEGYKVADAIVKHGAGASSFSDWWAYKFEVFDAIPYNGALLHNAGAVVSFNSDDAELARRLNSEAAKAIKYGNVPPEEALKFVTLNPAKQLRIDSRVGSLEPGKDADVVVWSGSPVSSLSRCEQTWVDGRRYFDVQEDQSAQRETAALHAALVQRILASGDETERPDENKKDRWPNEDTYCDHDGHGH